MSVCKYIQAQANDGCWSLAQRCGISQDDLIKYNPTTHLQSDLFYQQYTPPQAIDQINLVLQNQVAGFCDSITVGQYVCCSPGSLPDFSPKPNPDGTCYDYTIIVNDTCAKIASAHTMVPSKISTVNNLTWGWSGCEYVQAGQKICLSEGIPPFPAPMSQANCGPQVPGTTQPAGVSPAEWARLNPCPLNACCDIWGQCGITPEFCTPNPADTGAPGTAKPNTNGCISNCGTNIINNGHRPDQYKRIGYFESWNLYRPCLNMDISKVQDLDRYTHVHFAFANISTNWEVDVSDVQTQFDGLLKLTKIQRILSFGGWGFSTDAYTHAIFRNGVKDGNRQILASNIVNFIVQHNLDGIDFDWEYPGAQDIPGIPPDDPDSGANYLEFLKLVKEKLPAPKTLSIAAPASYWYLKGFPIKDIATVVDYIVFMTYDLHGQWDYGSKFSNPGCSNGNCLRSHVNKTETEYALAMITKAGVDARKVMAGLALYGRSFQMTQPNCAGVDCTFTGPDSGAEAGLCTGTAGYLANSEINGIIGSANDPDMYGNVTIRQYQDEGDILIYDETNWVSYLSPVSFLARQLWTDSLFFGGTVDWAIDLDKSYANNGTGDLQDDDDDDESDFRPCDYSLTFSSLDALSAASAGLRTDCIAAYTIQVLIGMLNSAYDNYTSVDNGYDATFGYYVTYMKNLVPGVLVNEFMWNMSTTGQFASVPDAGFGMNYFSCDLGDGKGTFPCSGIESKGPAALEEHTTKLTLTDSDGYNGGLVDVGLAPEWVVLGNYEMDREITAPRGGHIFKFKFSGFPVENSTMVVPNPKDIVTQGIGSIPALRTSMEATLLDIMLGGWSGGSLSDAAQAYSTPVFMLIQAVENMAQAKALGEKEEQDEKAEEERRKNLILLIVTAVLMFVPVIGEEAAAAAGFASLARGIAITGELGNGALAIYQTVEDPSSAIVNVLGMLFGVGAITKASRDGEGIAAVAKFRKGMDADEISSLGAIFKGNDDKLQTVLKVCNLK